MAKDLGFCGIVPIRKISLIKPDRTFESLEVALSILKNEGFPYNNATVVSKPAEGGLPNEYLPVIQLSDYLPALEHARAKALLVERMVFGDPYPSWNGEKVYDLYLNVTAVKDKFEGFRYLD